MMEGGCLILAGTPIGDSEDASPNLVQVLESADVIAAEDTRKFRTLCTRIGAKPQGSVVSYFEGNEDQRIPALVAAMESGQRVVLVTDAGMPAVSDPGYQLVRAAIAADIPVTSVPGPSAVVTALAVSGLPVDRFTFEGFAPRKAGARANVFAELADERRTMVFYEAPHRLHEFLSATAEAFGADRQAVVCRELTKTYEEIVRGTLRELAEWAQSEIKGEITVVIAGASESATSLPDAVALVLDQVEQGEKFSKAVSVVARTTGVKRNDLYEAALAKRDEGRQ